MLKQKSKFINRFLTSLMAFAMVFQMIPVNADSLGEKSNSAEKTPSAIAQNSVEEKSEINSTEIQLMAQPVAKSLAPKSNWVTAGAAAVSGTDYNILDNGDVEVHTARGLAWVSVQVASKESFHEKTIFLTNNIDLTTGAVNNYGGTGNSPSSTVTNLNDWLPIGGSGETPFEGSFNGNGFTVSGLYIVDDKSRISGLFGYVKGDNTVGSQIINVGIINSSIENTDNSSNSYTGALVGYSTNTLFANCYSTAKVQSVGTDSSLDYVGGLVGYFVATDLTSHIDFVNCYSLGTVLGPSTKAKVGGVVGLMTSLTFNNIYSVPTNEMVDSDSSDSLNIGALTGENGFDEYSGVKNAFYRNGMTGNGESKEPSYVNEFSKEVTDSYLKSSSFVDDLNKWVSENYYDFKTREKSPYELVSWEYNPGSYPTLSKEFIAPAWQTVGENASSSNDYTVDELGNVTVKTAAGLAWVAYQVNSGENDFKDKTVTLENDIDLREAGVAGYGGTGNIPSSTVTDLNSWIPIGATYGMVFAGDFNGNGNTISGMYIVGSEYSTLGLFGKTQYASVSNVILINSSIDTTIENELHPGAGSIVGLLYGSDIYNCFSSADVNINTIYSNSNLRAGALVGVLSSSSSAVNCVATGDVSSDAKKASLGGLIGENYISEVYNSYSAGKVSGENLADVKVGGVCGEIDSNKFGLDYHVYYSSVNANAYGMANSGIDSGYWVKKTDSELKSDSFINTLNLRVASSDNPNLYFWGISPISDYPVPTLKDSVNEWVVLGNSAVENTDYTHDSSNKRISIYTAKGLAWLANTVNNGNDLKSYYVSLENDIDLTTANIPGYGGSGNTYNSTVNSLNSWVPIGLSEENSFSGILLGNDNTISGLYINKNLGIGALFGYVSEFGTVKNLTINNSKISAQNVSSFVYELEGYITNCVNFGDLDAENATYIGGIASSLYGNMTACFNHGDIKASSASSLYVGGLAGYQSGKITSSGNYGNINSSSTGDETVGGISGYAGTALPTDGYIFNSFNQGDVSVTGLTDADSLGGIFGKAINYASITNSYNSGVLTPNSGAKVGGVIGERFSHTGTIKLTYYLDSTATKAVGTGTSAGTKLTDLALQQKSDDLNDWVYSEQEKKEYWWSATSGNYPELSSNLPDNIFTVTMSGEATSSHVLAKVGEEITIGVTIPTGKVFKGWVVSNNNVIPTLDTAEINTKFNMPAFNVVLTPDMETRTYNVKFDANGGTGSVDDITAMYNYAFALPAKDSFTHPDGKFIDGWSLSPSGPKLASNSYRPLFEDRDEFTLYAVWRDPYKYNIEFVSNSVFSTTTAMPTLQATENVALTLPESTFVAKDGYYYIGWSLSSTGSPLLGDSHTFTSHDRVYAVWKDTYEISFVANGGTGTMPSMTAYEDKNLTLPNNTFDAPKDYEFKGWSLTADGATLLSPTHQFTGKTTVYAIWEAIDFITISFNANGGSGVMLDEKVQSGVSFTLPANEDFNPEHGMTFAGWSLTADGSLLPATYTFTVDTQVYAIWKTAQIYTISFNANGGTGSMDSSTAFEGIEYILPLVTEFTAPSGKVLAGWSLTSDGSTIVNEYIFTADATVYAVWKNARELTISFDANGGKGAKIPDVKINEGQKLVLPENTYTAPAGKEFLGWYTEIPKADDTNFIIYKSPFDTTVFSLDTPTNITMYAIWVTTDSNYSTLTLSGVGEVAELTLFDICYIVPNNSIFNVTDELEFGSFVFSYTKDGKTPTGSSFMVTQDTNVYIAVGPTMHVVEISAGANGMILPFGKNYAFSDSTMNLTFKPDSGYMLSQVTVNGTPVSVKDNKYTLTNINSDTKVEATFKVSGNTLISVSVADWTYGMSASTPEVGFDGLATGGALSYSYEGRDGTSYTATSTPPTAVGKYKLTVTSAANGTIPSKSLSTNFEILKGTKEGGSIDLVIKNTTTTEQSVDLSKFIPTGETATINTTVTEDINSIISMLSATSTAVKFTPSAPTAGDTAKLIATIETANYNDIVVAINIRITDKTPQTIQFTKDSIFKTLGDATFTNSLTATPVGTVSYSSSNTAVATVDSNGVVTIVDVGTATISAIAAGDASVESANASYDLTVNSIPATSLEELKDYIASFKGDFAYLESIVFNGVKLKLTYSPDGKTAYLSGYPAGDTTIIGEAVSGSIVVTLYKDFLRTLPNGNYTLSVTSLSPEEIITPAGSTVVNVPESVTPTPTPVVTPTPTPGTPSTGDNSAIPLAIAFVLVVTLVAVGLIIYKKRTISRI